jgi:hypothetical protein
MLTLWTHHGSVAFADAVKKREAWAVRLLADHVLGTPTERGTDGEADGAEEAALVALDPTAAEGAVAPAPRPRAKTVREVAEEEVLAEAEREGPYHGTAVRALMAGLSHDELARRVEERLGGELTQDGVRKRRGPRA